MKVSGFSFIRNAIEFDYPIVEAILSILPICDDFYLAVGNSKDDTLSLIQNLKQPKIHIIPTIWDDSLRQGGQVLAVETNKAFHAIPNDSDWCFYIQGDEVLHEKYLENVQKAMKKYQNRKEVEGLLFRYQHFYGSYDYVGSSRKWYRNEIRVIRNDKNISSWKDAQGFRKNGKKLKVVPIDAEIYHYGWVKNPEFQLKKQQNFHKLWHDDNWIRENVPQNFDYSEIDKLDIFKGTHPKVMQLRIQTQNWKFDFDISKDNRKLKDKILDFLEKITRKRLFEYQNYQLLKP